MLDDQAQNLDFQDVFATYQAGAFTAATIGARRLLAGDPAAGQAMHLLALASYQLGRLADAALWLQRAAGLLPQNDLADALANLSAVLLGLGRREEALEAAARASMLAPAKARPLCAEAAVLRDGLQPATALIAARRASCLEPGSAEAWAMTGNCLQAAGAVDRAVGAYDRAIALAPDDILAHGNKLFTLSFVAGVDDARLFREARAWGERIERHWPPSPPKPRRATNRRLRLGYHAFEFFSRSMLDDYFPPVLRHHDRSKFELILLADGGRRDSRTEELRRLADRWIDLSGLDLAAKVERMRSVDLDIAVCLTGYLPIHRVVFAPRVAPIQVAQMNHVATTGLKAFDYRITDRWLDPPGETEHLNTERLVRIESGYVPAAAPEPAPPLRTLPALAKGHVTFGSFNNLSKVTPSSLALWAGVLSAVPGARLRLKARVLDDPRVRERYRQLAEEAGIDTARLEFIGQVSGHAEHLNAVGEADIALDPTPFSGGHSTIDALWMGVPVINLRTQSLVGRLGSSLLCRAGLDRLVAASAEEFVAIAVGLAKNLDALARLRAGMRSQLLGTSLFDAEAYTRQIEAAFEAMTRGEI